MNYPQVIKGFLDTRNGMPVLNGFLIKFTVINTKAHTAALFTNTNHTTLLENGELDFLMKLRFKRSSMYCFTSGYNGRGIER